MIKALIITYYWPPGSGAGVQRWLKFSKYLPQYGWNPVILTVDPRYATYPSTDNSLEKEISGELRIFRTKATDYFRLYNKDKSKVPTAGFAADDKKGMFSRIKRFARGNFFIPDPRKGWNKFAFNEACRIIETEGIKHIITTSPPHSTHLIGLKLKSRYPDIKWIADLRDPWTDIYYYDQFYPTFISRFIDRRYEKKVLQNADIIIVVGKSLKELFVSKIHEIENKTWIVTNGFDDEDFKGAIHKKNDMFTISYIGTLSDIYPINNFLEVLGNIKNNGREIKLKFIGTLSPSQEELILTKTLQSNIEFIPYVNHHDAVKYMVNSDLLLLIIPKHHSSRSIITGKIFEYLASGNPVLCLGPVDGDAAEIIKISGAGNTFDYNDKNGMEEFILSAYSGSHMTDPGKISGFSRKELTKRIALLLST